MGVPQSEVLSQPDHRVKDAPCRRKLLRSLLGVLLIFSIVTILSRGITGITLHHWKAETGVKAADMQWEPGFHCRGTPLGQARTSEAIIFGAEQTLAVRQKIDTSGPRTGHYPEVYGRIVVQPSHALSAGGKIDVQVMTSVEDVDVGVTFDADSQDLVVTTPEWVDEAQVCIQIIIAVSVPKTGVRLQSILVESVHLDVQVRDGLELDSQSAVISTVVGDVATGGEASYTLASRSIVVETVSGNVRGWFPLYDHLGIKTVSGEVGVDLTPEPASSDGDAALLEVSSASGTLVVREALEVPLRNYVTRMSTVSGDIDAHVAFSEGKFESQSGDLRLRLLPVQDEDERSRLETSSKSGETNVDLLEPLSTGSLSLQSKHGSISGNVNIAYPSAWEGSFSMSTMSGRQSVRGEGLEYRRGGGFVTRRIEGSKGHGESVMTMETVTGSEKLTVGDV